MTMSALRRFPHPARMTTCSRLAIVVLSIAAVSGAAASELRAAEAFSSISDKVERSRALFVEAGRVLQHPRCINCHPIGERPTQGEDKHPHSPLVVRGLDDKGATAMRCTTCHQSANFATSGVPGHRQWHMAPREMGWQGKTLAQICEQIKDPRRNGTKTLAQIHDHIARDSLVGWAWAPGANRESAPGTQEQLGTLIAAWIETGAACPAGQ
jgi:hypothetical protein